MGSCTQPDILLDAASCISCLNVTCFEGLGDLIRAILLVLGGAHNVVSFFISFYFCPSLFFHYLLWKLSCHWWLFRMWSASLANVSLLIVIISGLSRHVIDIVLSL